MPERMIRSTERADALQFAGGVDRWRDFVAVKVLHFGERTYLVFGIHRGSLATGRPDERLVVAFAYGQGAGGGFQAQSRHGLGARLAVGLAGFFDTCLEGIDSPKLGTAICRERLF